MKRLSILVCLVCLTFTAFSNTSTKDNSLIQVAFLLDTSNSMDGLIDQAKAQLWNIANEISDAEMNGDIVRFEFALYEYGNTKIPKYKQHVRQVAGFTEDMDLISSQLFALKTSGGDEYCGQVIHNSLEELTWKDHAGLKVIYIAGNESFNQGNYPQDEACKEARNKEVKINTIYCGPFDNGISLNWNSGSSLSLGTYNNIDQNAKTIHIDTPYDEELVRLNSLLNETYVSYRTSGRYLKENQIAQDVNANTYLRANYAKRAIFKAKENYKNSSWDLIDAEEEGVNVFEYNDQLPEKLQSSNKAELEAKVKALKDKRKSIQEDISCIAKEREVYIANIKKEQHVENPFETSILNSLRAQLTAAGYMVK